MFERLDAQKPALKKLIAALRERYPYASVLATDEHFRSWRVSRNGITISSEGDGGYGFVIRVFDETGCAEYSINAFSEEMIPKIAAEMERRLEAERSALPEGITPMPTAIPDDSPAVLKKEAKYEIDPMDVGDEAILDLIRRIREKGMQAENILDIACNVTYCAERKLFLSEHRDLDETHMWTNAGVGAFGSRGEEVKDSYQGYSMLGGAELLKEVENDVDEVSRRLNDLLQSEPMIPGEYECVCDPEVTGMIVHEAFGHGVEMDMFVKDRAQAKQFIGEYVASPLVTMHDGSAVDECATWAFDDEGTLTGDTVIIDKGVLRRGMCDALSAMRLGTKPTGNGRRESYERKAYTRMTNTYFESGDATKEEMIASIKYGFLLEEPTSGMEDPKNWGIQCMVNVAREIRDGKLTGKVFSPIVLTGYVPDLLKSVSMMGGKVELAGGGYCGKGYKEWVKVSDGGAYMKARIRLG
ncbi:MAG: TldD/PmbA family protein [Clostridia bacterium]|nr:TldD/PmbA family protein [Clostridia bacterium]